MHVKNNEDYALKKTFVMPLLVLTLISVVVSSALALMNTFTQPVISSAAAQRAEIAMTQIIPNAEGFELIDLSNYTGIPVTVKEVYRTTNDVGYVFIAAVNGFSGDITIICGVGHDGRIIKTSTLSHTETQGIGTIIEQESFLSTFDGLDHNLEGVDTVTGATISTRAFIHAVSDIHEAFKQLTIDN